MPASPPKYKASPTEAKAEVPSQNEDKLPDAPGGAGSVTKPIAKIQVFLTAPYKEAGNLPYIQVQFADRKLASTFLQRITHKMIEELKIIDTKKLSTIIKTRAFYPNETQDRPAIDFVMTDVGSELDLNYDNLIRAGLGENTPLKEEKPHTKRDLSKIVKDRLQDYAKLIVDKSNTETQFLLTENFDKEDFKIFKQALYAELKQNPDRWQTLNLVLPCTLRTETESLERYKSLASQGKNLTQVAAKIQHAFDLAPKKRMATLQAKSLQALQNNNFELFAFFADRMKNISKAIPVAKTFDSQAPAEYKNEKPKL